MKKRWMLGICAALLCLGPVSLSASQIQTDETAILEERANPEEGWPRTVFPAGGWKMVPGSAIRMEKSLPDFFRKAADGITLTRQEE